MTTADVTFTVGPQQETTEMDAQGNIVKVVNVSFKTGSGVSGTVTIPKDDYTVENVRNAILDYAQKLHAVSQLTG